MCLIKYNENDKIRFFYCSDNKNKCILPELNNKNELKQEYKINEIMIGEYPEYKNLIDLFMDNLDENDIIKTHDNVYKPNELINDEITVKLKQYFI